MHSRLMHILNFDHIWYWISTVEDLCVTVFSEIIEESQDIVSVVFWDIPCYAFNYSFQYENFLIQYLTNLVWRFWVCNQNYNFAIEQ